MSNPAFNEGERQTPKDKRSNPAVEERKGFKKQMRSDPAVKDREAESETK